MTRKREVVREVLVVHVRRGIPLRVLVAVVLIAAALAVVWGSMFRGELAAIELPATPDALPTPSAQAGNQLGFEPIQPAPSEPATTTTAPPEAPAAVEADPPAPEPPAGAADEPDQAAQAWYATNGDHGGAEPDQVQVLQLPRCDHNTFHAVVTVNKDHRWHGAVLEIVRVDGNFWKFHRVIQQHEVCG